MYNRIGLQGRLTEVPEIKHTPNGTAGQPTANVKQTFSKSKHGAAQQNISASILKRDSRSSLTAALIQKHTTIKTETEEKMFM